MDEDSFHKRSTSYIILWSTLLILSSCVNDMSEVYQLTAKDEGPFEISHNIKLIYSEKGQVQLKVKAPLLERYTTDRPYLEMTEGIEVLFYDSLLNVTTRLTANYAISFEDDNITEARNDVVVVNEFDERLNTEHLVWDENKGIIYSDVFVTITTETEVLYGEGFISDEKFEKWTLKKPQGSFIIEHEEDETEQ